MSCSKVLATSYQLDLHISERHDPFFVVALEGSGPDVKLYKCLVESCSECFESDSHRSKHLVAAHAYPTWYSFHGKTQAKIQKQRYRDKKSASQKATACKFLATKKGCRYGDKCRFSHDEARSRTLSSSMDESCGDSEDDDACDDKDDDLMMELMDTVQKIAVVPKRIAFGSKKR